jgi:hypothetical protein
MSASRKALRTEAIFWLLVMAAAVIFSTVLLIANARLRSNLADLQTGNEQLTVQMADLQQKCVEYEEITKNQPGLLPWELEELQKRGLQDPLRDLVADLQKHPELIPHKGVLGGTMAFGFPEKIHVLTEKYVLAYYEDGHIAGWMLLEYSVARGGKISWRVIDTYID